MAPQNQDVPLQASKPPYQNLKNSPTDRSADQDASKVFAISAPEDQKMSPVEQRVAEMYATKMRLNIQGLNVRQKDKIIIIDYQIGPDGIPSRQQNVEGSMGYRLVVDTNKCQTDSTCRQGVLAESYDVIAGNSPDGNQRYMVGKVNRLVGNASLSGNLAEGRGAILWTPDGAKPNPRLGADEVEAARAATDALKTATAAPAQPRPLAPHAP